jgi:hypothetical protein
MLSCMRRFLLLLLTLLTGCDTGYGLYRHGHVSFMPPPQQVSAAVQGTPGVDEVEYRLSEGGRPITLFGIKSPEQVYTFSYRGSSNVHASLQFVVDYNGRVEYSQSLMRLGRPPPQETIDATRPVMLQIEGRLEQSCGLSNLQASVEEICRGVKCK